jgi:hypothetical protein
MEVLHGRLSKLAESPIKDEHTLAATPLTQPFTGGVLEKDRQPAVSQPQVAHF